METLKTAVVVILLLAVLYGVYQVLNNPDPAFVDQDNLAWEAGGDLGPLQIEEGSQPANDETLRALTQSNPVDLAMDTTENATAPRQSPAPVTSPAFPPLPNADPLAAAPSPTYVQPSVPAAVENPLSDGSATSVYSQPASPENGIVALDNGESGTSSAQESVYAPSRSTISDEVPAVVSSFEKMMNSARGQIDNQQWASALLTLSLFYNNPDLTSSEQQQLVDLLDPLAGKVIYSNEHLLERPYTVQVGETLEQIASQYQVPAMLLQNINGVQDPNQLTPGTQLKVVRGPFRAEVDVSKGELTLFVQRYYAGRFPVSVGNEPAPQPGDFQVQQKSPGRMYQARDGRTFQAGHPQNPYGDSWLDLGNQLSIHGSPSVAGGSGSFGCISLSPQDARDIYGILATGSRVTILR